MDHSGWKQDIIEGAVPQKKDFTPPKWVIALCAAAMSSLVLFAMRPPFIQQRETSKYMDNKNIHVPSLLVFGGAVFLTVLIADSQEARGYFFP